MTFRFSLDIFHFWPSFQWTSIYKVTWSKVCPITYLFMLLFERAHSVVAAKGHCQFFLTIPHSVSRKPPFQAFSDHLNN